MYERMLNKQEQPQYNEMCMHCKECGELFAGLNTWLYGNICNASGHYLSLW